LRFDCESVKVGHMRGISLSFLTIAGCVLAGVTGLASANTLAIPPGVHVFEAHLQESPCGSNTTCGTGKLTGFGRFKTRETFRFVGAPPALGCANGVATRTLRLARDRKSVLRLAVNGTLCGSLHRGWGTFKVSSGRGAFAGATGSGVILDSLTAAGHGSLHLSGVFTLPGK
jgi:hypothetical protein